MAQQLALYIRVVFFHSNANAQKTQHQHIR